MMHHWIVASVATDLRKYRSVEVLNDACRRNYYITEQNLERLRSRRRKEHSKLQGKHSYDDFSKQQHSLAHHPRSPKTPDKLFPPIQITVAKSWDDVTSCGRSPIKGRKLSAGRLLSPTDLPIIARSKSHGDVTESLKAFHGSRNLLSPTLLSPSSPTQNGGFQIPSTVSSCSDLTRSVSDYDVRSDKVKLIKHRKRSGSWNCLKSVNSSPDSSPERQRAPVHYSVFNSLKPSTSVDTFGRRTGEKGLRAWLGLNAKRNPSPPRKSHQ